MGECNRTILQNLKQKKYSYHQLNRCYRTTLEIIEFANKIFRERFPKTYKLPEAVLRHGEEIHMIDNQKDIDNISEKGTT